MVFLQETKCSETDLKSIGGKAWKGSEIVAVDVIKVAGGIGILWNPKEVLLYNFSVTQYSLSAAFHIIGIDIRGFLTNVYGPPRAEQKVNFRDSLRMINTLTEGKPWIIGGDFNLINSLEEKKRGDPSAKPHNSNFQ